MRRRVRSFVLDPEGDIIDERMDPKDIPEDVRQAEEIEMQTFRSQEQEAEGEEEEERPQPGPSQPKRPVIKKPEVMTVVVKRKAPRRAIKVSQLGLTFAAVTVQPWDKERLQMVMHIEPNSPCQGKLVQYDIIGGINQYNKVPDPKNIVLRNLRTRFRVLANNPFRVLQTEALPLLPKLLKSAPRHRMKIQRPSPHVYTKGMNAPQRRWQHDFGVANEWGFEVTRITTPPYRGESHAAYLFNFCTWTEVLTKNAQLHPGDILISINGKNLVAEEERGRSLDDILDAMTHRLTWIEIIPCSELRANRIMARMKEELLEEIEDEGEVGAITTSLWNILTCGCAKGS